MTKIYSFEPLTAKSEIITIPDSFIPPTRKISTGNGLSGGGDLSADRTISLANTAVAAGSYTLTALTVDAQGRITAASNGSTTASKPLFDHYADVSNSGTSETSLYSDTLAASVLAANGEKANARYGGVFSGAVSATQQLRAYFGGNLIFDSGALAIGVASPNWDLSVSVIRESSTVVRCSAAFTSSSAALAADAQYTRITGLTLSNTQILKITGTAGGINGASNQITASLGFVEWRPAA